MACVDLVIFLGRGYHMVDRRAVHLPRGSGRVTDILHLAGNGLLTGCIRPLSRGSFTHQTAPDEKKVVSLPRHLLHSPAARAG